MAPLPRSSPAGMRLAELLQEQQEPFLLDVYLLEHGCSRTILCPEATPVCWPGNACRKLQRLARHGFHRRRKGILRSLLALFVHWRAPNASNWYRKALEEGGHSDKRRKAASSTAQLPCFSRNVDGDLGKIKVDAERNQEWERPEEAKQLSPVSVLELHSEDMDSPTHGQIRVEDPSPSGHSLPIEVSSDAFEELHGSAVASKSMRTKRELRGLKQPLLVCLEFEDENKRGHENEQRDQHCHELVLSSRRRGLMIRCSQVFTQISRADAAAITDRFIASDVSESRIRWSGFHPDVVEISAEIGDEIFDDLALDLVSHMTQIFSRWK